ncbi:hypothetical protein AVEN_63685-1 [Araneus ventricosus]|uniref:Uncharacterized protein n=1 Tax=Araneus ventricosus TaxID=182803 RepID=A0A4Y2RH98_ARAVE|nr:hypothetical protein AVEN_63685-1 [Araneus ventricosus]
MGLPSMGQVVDKKLIYVNFAGMVSETVCAEMLSRTCRSNLVGEVVHKKAFLCKPCGNGFRNGLRGNAFAGSLWKVKRQPSLLSELERSRTRSWHAGLSRHPGGPRT